MLAALYIGDVSLVEIVVVRLVLEYWGVSWRLT